MADEQTPDAADAPDESAETPQHAVPGEDAAEIAGSAEDAALEAAEEAAESGAQAPEPPTVEPAACEARVPCPGARSFCQPSRRTAGVSSTRSSSTRGCLTRPSVPERPGA